MANPNLAPGALQKPARGTALLAREADDAQRVAHELAIAKAVKKRDTRCRWPEAHTCLGGPLEAVHILDKSLLGPTSPENVVTLAKPVKVCLHCGVPITRKSHIASAKYCSKRCAYDHWRTLPRKKVLPPCRVCGGPMPTRTCKGQNTCSMKCGYIHRKNSIRPQRPCNHCGELYWPKTAVRLKYCSRRCYKASAARRLAIQALVCAQCGASFRRTMGAIVRVRRSFCSPKCAVDARFRSAQSPNRGRRWKHLAESIRKRDGYVCLRCGKTQAENLVPLAVDHVLPWRSFADKSAANNPSNLTSLCRSCHCHKTMRVEARWLLGDRIPMQQWIASLTLPSAVLGLEAST